MRLMPQADDLTNNLTRMIEAARILSLPILWTEQAPDKIGKTIPQIAGLLKDNSPIEKISFSCCRDAVFMQALGRLEKKQILMTGIETHVCVYQTARDLIAAGFDVQLILDAVSSRNEFNKHVGVEKIKAMGGHVTSVETVVCELLGEAKGNQFKEILKLIK